MQNGRYYRLMVALWMVCLVWVGVARAASLRFIDISDTLDTSIGTTHDLQKVSAWAKSIASDTGLTLRLKTLSGSSVTPASARSAIRSLQSASDDVICFVYSGHGDNGGDSVWPTFTFVTDTFDTDVTFDEVVSTLKTKPHRLLVVLSDCCNVVGQGGGIGPVVPPSGRTAQAIQNLQHLFLDYQGMVKATSSKVGQYSLGDESTGGLFMTTFINDMDSLLGGTSEVTWDKVLSTTAADTTRQAKAIIAEGDLGNIQAQEPYYVADVQQTDSGSSGDGSGGDAGGTTGDDPSDPNTPSTVRSGECGDAGLAPLVLTMTGFLAFMAGRRTYLSR